MGSEMCIRDRPEGGWEAYEWWEDGISCVEYEDSSSGEKRLGVYVKYSLVEGEPHIRPLCAATEDDGISCLFCDEDVPIVPLDRVKKLLDPDYTFVSERQAGGGQGLGNPHGEHGEVKTPALQEPPQRNARGCASARSTHPPLAPWLCLAALVPADDDTVRAHCPFSRRRAMIFATSRCRRT